MERYNRLKTMTDKFLEKKSRNFRPAKALSRVSTIQLHFFILNKVRYTFCYKLRRSQLLSKLKSTQRRRYNQLCNELLKML